MFYKNLLGTKYVSDPIVKTGSEGKKKTDVRKSFLWKPILKTSWPLVTVSTGYYLNILSASYCPSYTGLEVQTSEPPLVLGSKLGILYSDATP